MGLICVALAALAGALGGSSAPPYDLIVRSGLVVDGSGAPGRRLDVGISAGRIVRLGNLQTATAADTIDASGLVVAPGFIDVHTHAEDVTQRPLAENFIRMGVTTIVAGNCGSAAAGVGEALAAVERAGVAVNYATLAGHNTIRQQVIGSERRSPTPAELTRMKTLVAQAMAEGAFGLSTGLQYVPGVYADQAEIIELASVAGAAGGLYASHMRNEGTDIENAVRETIAVGEAARCPVQISHLKIDSPQQWGASPRVLALMDEARRRGVNVRADQYAYTAGASDLSIRFPAWALEGGHRQINARLDDEGTWKQIKAEMKQLYGERGFVDLSWAVVANYRPNPSWNGLSIKQIAALTRGTDDADAQLEVAREMLRGGDAQMVYHFMSERDVVRFMQHPQVAIASDSSVLTPGAGMPHPRGYGNNARVLGHYVRELKAITLEEAVRKMTALPAAQFGLVGRGMVREGYAADLVIFDPRTVADQATYTAPHRFPIGIAHVIVNGALAVRDGQQTGRRAGQVLRHAERMRARDPRLPWSSGGRPGC